MARSNLAAVLPLSNSTSQGTKESFNAKKAIQESLTSEIVIALCGPLGTPLHEVATTFQKLLKTTDYSYDKVEIIRLSQIIKDHTPKDILSSSPSINELIDAGNNLRQTHGNDVLARLAIKKNNSCERIIKSKTREKTKRLILRDRSQFRIK